MLEKNCLTSGGHLSSEKEMKGEDGADGESQEGQFGSGR